MWDVFFTDLVVVIKVMIDQSCSSAKIIWRWHIGANRVLRGQEAAVAKHSRANEVHSCLVHDHTDYMNMAVKLQHEAVSQDQGEHQKTTILD
jgi:hypothetical protein